MRKAERNNIVIDTNFSDEIVAGFVGVSGYVVHALKGPDGDINITVSRNLNKIRNLA